MKKYLCLLLLAVLLSGCGAPSAQSEKAGGAAATTPASEIHAESIGAIVPAPDVAIQDVDTLPFYVATHQTPTDISMATDFHAMDGGCAVLGYFYNSDVTETVVQTYTADGLQFQQTLEVAADGYAEAFAVDTASETVYYLETIQTETATTRFLHCGDQAIEISALLPETRSVQALGIFENQLLLVADTGLFQFSTAGDLLAEIPSEASLSDLLFTADGSPVILSQTSDGIVFFTVGEQTLTIAGQLPEAYSDYSVVSGMGTAYDCLLYDNQFLYGWTFQSELLVPLLDFLDAGLNPNYISVFASIGGSNYFGMDWVSGESGDRLFWLRQSERPETQISLTIGCIAVPTALYTAVSDFNAEHPEYAVSILDYDAQYGDRAETQLRMDLLSGDGPDLLCLNGLNSSVYAAQGYLANLYPFMDADGEFSREAFLEGPLSVLELTGGELYQLPLSVSISAVAGLASVWGGQSKIDWDTFYTVTAAYPTANVFPDQSPSTLLTELVFQNLSQFVDYETGTASFESNAFIQLLEFAGSQSTEQALSNSDAIACLYQKELLLAPLLLTSFEAYAAIDAQLNDDCILTGYPGAGGPALYLNTPMAIAAQSAQQEVAWEFLTYFLSNARYRNRGGWSLVQCEFDAAVSSALASDVSQEAVDTVIALLQTIDHIAAYDETITNIVSEEAASFFQGIQDAQTAAFYIQQRVQTYLWEQA